MKEHFYNFLLSLFFLLSSFSLFSFQQWKLILIFQRQIATNGNKKLKHSPFYFFIKKQKSVFLFHLMKILEINVIYESEWVQSEVVNNKNQYEVKCIVVKKFSLSTPCCTKVPLLRKSEREYYEKLII